MSNKSIFNQRKNQYGKKEFEPVIMPTRNSIYRLKSTGTGKPKQRRLKKGYIQREGQIYKSIIYAGVGRLKRILFADEM